MKKKLTTMLYGGDYNPEQWPEKSWNDDIKIFEEADINSVTINVFSWALLQPNENTYDFSILDKIIDKFTKKNFKIVLATATAALPAWMFKKYPDVARVDYQGRRHVFGQRHNACPNSPNYLRLMQKLVDKIAQRYASNSNIVVWHINNEYGGNCYCDNCQSAFRKWLKNRYQTVEKLNSAWNMNFWSHTIYEWDEIVVPNELGDAFGPENSETTVAGLSVDYLRFQSESMLNTFKLEKQIIESYDPDTLITTNFHGLPNKQTDYASWAKEQDIIAYDSYPTFETPAFETAFMYDMMRGLGNGNPFMLMESTPSQVNWQAYSPLKRPGQLRATEFQAVAHGADTVQYFQLKQSLGATEKFHGAVISHSDSTDTRAFKEVAQLGHDLKKISSDIMHTTTSAKVGILFDWANYWSVEYMATITQDLNYTKLIHDYYKALYNNNVTVDVIDIDSDFSKYDLLVAPLLYMVKDGLGKKIEDYVANGGNFLTTYFSGLVNESDKIYPGGYPGPLKKVTGLWVEETDAIIPQNKVTINYDDKTTCTGNLVSDIIRLEGAEAIATYASEFYAGTPAVTKNNFGKGVAYYVGTHLDDSGLTHLFKYLITKIGLSQLSTNINPSLDITERHNEKDTFYFILNMSNEPQELPSEFKNSQFIDILTSSKPENTLDPWAVTILKK